VSANNRLLQADRIFLDVGARAAGAADAGREGRALLHNSTIMESIFSPSTW